MKYQHILILPKGLCCNLKGFVKFYKNILNWKKLKLMIPYHEFKPHIKSDDEVNLFTEANWMQYQWRIQDFPEGGRANSQKCYYFSIFLPKTAWKWKNLDPQGESWRPLPLDPPVNTLY